jgi:peptidoglycan biosynthesis protein MviN/MurJ (putative lipid II flippase)
VRRVFLRLVLGGVLGKVLGVLRETLLAALFGAGRVVAANRVALTGTFIPINFFTADALSAGFLPLYVRYRKDSATMALALYRGVRLLLGVFSLALVAALLVAADSWVHLIAPGLDPETSHIAAAMLRAAGLGVPFYIQYNLYTLVALAHEDVRLINLRASFQSIGLIGGTLVAYTTGRVALLAWGFTVPYVLLCVWGTVWVRRRGYLATDRPSTVDLDYRVALATFWRRLRPLLLIPLILQGSIAVERIVGSLLGVEVVAATEYARFIVDSCMALLAAPLGLAGLASFARMEPEQVAAGLRRLVRAILLVTVPLSLVLCLDAEGIVHLLYARGQFDQHAVRTSSVMLAGFALGIWAQVLGYTLVKVLNARGANTRVAVVNGLSFSAALIANLALYRIWGAFTLGAAASLGGLVLSVTAARSLEIIRFTGRLLATLAPGAAVAGLAGWLLNGPGPAHLAVSATAILAVWLLYLAAVPPLRAALLSEFRRGSRIAVAPAGPRP